jgi:hypothetical protein
MEFEVSAGSTELTDLAVVKGFAAIQVSCSTGAEDIVEEVATTGGTVLRCHSDWYRPAHLQLADAEEATRLLQGHDDNPGWLSAQRALRSSSKCLTGGVGARSGPQSYKLRLEHAGAGPPGLRPPTTLSPRGQRSQRRGLRPVSLLSR